MSTLTAPGTDISGVHGLPDPRPTRRGRVSRRVPAPTGGASEDHMNGWVVAAAVAVGVTIFTTLATQIFSTL